LNGFAEKTEVLVAVQQTSSIGAYAARVPATTADVPNAAPTTVKLAGERDPER